MRSGVTSEVAIALGERVVYGMVFVELLMQAGPIRACNATHDVDWNGYTWQGAGLVGRVQAIEEGLDAQMRGVAVELSGVPLELIPQALNAQYFGRRLTIWYAALDPDTHLPLDDPFIVFRGRMDTMPFKIGEQASFTITAESRDAAGRNRKIRRYTHEDQQARYPGDGGLRFAATMVERQLRWVRG